MFVVDVAMNILAIYILIQPENGLRGSHLKPITLTLAMKGVIANP
jgi:hypothetical protein